MYVIHNTSYNTYIIFIYIAKVFFTCIVSALHLLYMCIYKLKEY